MRDSVTLALVLTLLALATTSSSGQLVPAASPDMVTADSLIALYLRLENALWQVVRSTTADTADKIKRIHETHLTLLETDFREKGMPLDRLDADQAQLYNAIAYINMTQRSVLNGYLHENARDRTRDNALTFARHGVNMSQNLERIFNVTETMDFYNYIARRGQLQSCELGVSTVQSPHQMLYDYYHDLAVAQLKAYALAQLANMFVTVYDVQRISVGAADQLRRLYLQRSARGQERVRQLMGQASREVWVCDPDDASRMQHAAEVTRLLQGYVDNEVNLNEVNDCKKTCADYPSTRNYQCFNGSHCADNQAVLPLEALRCGGAVVGCEFVSADMEICHSNDPTRRYDGIKYTCGKKMGEQPDTCTTLKTQATSWTRWLVQCSQCFCYCDEPGPHSDRYFSLRPVESDITKNMVIVGVAIRKINRIFYWQIIERPLIANGEVSQSAAHTVPTDGEFALRQTFRLTDPHIVDGIDYHTLSHVNRSVNLDVLQVPAGRVCTGVRFAIEAGSLKVSIRGTRFNFKSGQLSLLAEDNTWLAKTIYERKQIVPVEGLPVPTRSLSKSVPDLRPNHFIEFGPSDKWTDVAQRTVPFVDTQTVRPQVFVPLAGVGLYYKSVPNFGGYVAPKLVTFDYMSYVKNV